MVQHLSQSQAVASVSSLAIAEITPTYVLQVPQIQEPAAQKKSMLTVRLPRLAQQLKNKCLEISWAGLRTRPFF